MITLAILGVCMYLSIKHYEKVSKWMDNFFN